MPRHRAQRYLLPLALFLAVALVVALGTRRIWTVDYWWQWATGQYIAEQGIPHHAIHSATHPDHPRIELRWAYCLGLYATAEWFGRGSAVVFKCAAILASFLLVSTAAARRQNLLVAAAVVVCAALAASQRFFVRPEVLSYLWFSVFLAVIALARRRRTRWVAVLPLVQVAWVNTHSFFPLGPLVLGCWLFVEVTGRLLDGRFRRPKDPGRGRRARLSALLLGATLGASLINPYLHRALLLPLEQFRALHGTAMKGFYSELVSPFDLPPSFTALFYYKLLIGLTLLAALLGIRRLSGFWSILTLAMFYLSATSVRNLPLFCLAAVPFTLIHLRRSGIAQRCAELTGRKTVGALGALALAVFCVYQLHQLVTDRFNVRQGDSNQFGIGVASQRYPEEGTRFLQRSGVRGPMFNSSESGSYLMAQGFDVFIDPRGEVYQDEWIDVYRRIVEDPRETERAIERFDLRLFFLETEMAALAARLDARPDWRIVYADAVTTILMRRDTAPQLPALDLDSDSWWRQARSRLPAPVAYADAAWAARVTSPRPYSRLARLCSTYGAQGPARVLFEDARRAYPAGFTDLEPLAYAADRSGEYAAAARYYLEAFEAAPDQVELGKRLALARFKLGDHEAARETIDRYLAERPADAEALALRGNVELELGRPDAAVRWLERAIEVAPAEAPYRYYHGRLLLRLGRFESARRSLEAAVRLAPGHLEPVLDLIALSLQSGDAARARGWLRRARAIAPDDPRVRAAEQSIPGA